MKKIVLLFVCFLLPTIVYSTETATIRSSRGDFFISGKQSNRQVFVKQDGTTRQITNFGPWENIDEILLSKDESLLLINHRPNRARAYQLSVYDAKSLAHLKSITPGFGGSLFWTKNNRILLRFGCGSPCTVFQLYDSNLQKIAGTSEGCMQEFIDADVIVSIPCLYAMEGIFKIWSLSDGKLLFNKSLSGKYGQYYCEAVSIISPGKLEVELRKQDTARKETSFKEIITY